MEKYKAYSCDNDVNIIFAENDAVAEDVLQIKKQSHRFIDPQNAVIKHLGSIEIKPGLSWVVDKDSIDRSVFLDGWENCKCGDTVIVAWHDGSNFCYKKSCIILQSEYKDHKSRSFGCLVGWRHETKRNYDYEFRVSKSSIFSVVNLNPTLFR